MTNRLSFDNNIGDGIEFLLFLRQLSFKLCEIGTLGFYFRFDSLLFNSSLALFYDLLVVLKLVKTVDDQKSRDFSNVRLSRRFKTCINEKQSIFQQKISTLKNAIKTRKVLENQGLLCVVVFSYYIDGGATRNRTGE